MFPNENIPAFIIGILALCLTVLSYQCLKQKKMFSVRITADFMWMVHWFLMGGISAALALLVAMFRTSTIVFYKPEWKKFLIPLSIGLIFALTYLSPEISHYKYLPWLASTCMAISLYYHDDFIKCRSIMMVGALVWIAYALIMNSLPALITMLIITLSHAIGMIRYIRQIKKQNKGD